MPPSDDEYLDTARHAMMALEAQLYRSLGGPSPSRDQALAIAREMRDIVARAITVLGVDGAEEIVDWYERAGKRAMRDLGTSAWEEPETVEQAKARMGTLPAAPSPGVLDRVNEQAPAPLTDEELTEIEVAAHTGKTGEPRALDHVWFDDLLRLVADVRRLRSDEWLRAAMEEIAREHDGTVNALASTLRHEPGARLDAPEWAWDALGAILRKHRDGKA